MNKYGLVEDELNKIRERDRSCVYCHKKMNKPSDCVCQQDWATIEHLNHLPPWDNISTVAICCGSCNSSRGKRRILDWFKSPYCQERGICLESVARSVREYVNKYEK